jgi:hypothetical protein
MSHAKSENPVVGMLPERGQLVRADQGDVDLTEGDKALIIRGLEAGQGIPAILREYPGIPGIAAINRAKKRDPAFAAAIDEARANGAEILVDEAIDYAFATRTNTKLSASANRYAQTAMAAAEKLAPKRFGPLLKLAGHDGNKLEVALVSYKDAGQAIEADYSEVQQLPSVGADDSTEHG